ncbi:hypothetical protein [Plantibacter cousiniae (nom. nud.)]|uniref:ATP synthase protein I n=1 Tax=Plantibacter cousiniae (nom. nud.) TaxID=199709 RepID=A0ABY1LQG6_9MICO|nr:hypothetical protein [Plantibacter cousiniae]SKC73585.1 hypothetical protein SAMN06295973_3514 [Plantibacter cousiniae]
MTPPAQAGSHASANRVFRTALRYSALLALVIAVVGGVVGWSVDGSRGLTSAFIGTAMALVFLGITSVSILFANRWSGQEFFVGILFGVVMGSWLVKFVIFLVLGFILKDQPWVNAPILFGSVIVGVVGSLVIDAVVAAKVRVPYVSDDILPKASPQDSDPS